MNFTPPRVPRPLWLGLSAIALLGAPVLASPQPRLIWNVSASVPTGLYLITYGDRLARGRLIAIEPPAAIASRMRARGYGDDDVPMLKTVAALAGDRVCRKDD